MLLEWDRHCNTCRGDGANAEHNFGLIGYEHTSWDRPPSTFVSLSAIGISIQRDDWQRQLPRVGEDGVFGKLFTGKAKQLRNHTTVVFEYQWIKCIWTCSFVAVLHCDCGHFGVWSHCLRAPRAVLRTRIKTQTEDGNHLSWSQKTWRGLWPHRMCQVLRKLLFLQIWPWGSWK